MRILFFTILLKLFSHIFGPKSWNILSSQKVPVFAHLVSGLRGLAHLLDSHWNRGSTPGSLAAAHWCGSYAICGAAILALTMPGPWCRRRCFDEILVRTAVPLTVLVQSVLRSTAVSVQSHAGSCVTHITVVRIPHVNLVPRYGTNLWCSAPCRKSKTCYR
eukprot:SAG11_NODE_8837_length_971_cov_1.511468_1_plen_160_part_01